MALLFPQIAISLPPLANLCMFPLTSICRFAKDPAAYCFKMCDWYPRSQQLQLSQNMRVQDANWAEFVSLIGSGSSVTFPDHCICASEDDLINAVCPNADFQAPGLRSILVMTREDCRRINAKIMDSFVGLPDVSLSLDSALDCDTDAYPVEFVNSCSISGMPDHILVLKKGASYMILHNVSAVLFNGTRVIYHRRVGKCLEVEIITGVHKGELQYLPRYYITQFTSQIQHHT
jgi:hypothetical protein